MKVSYGEDLANRTDPESCVCIRKGASEALTGESAGQVLSRESSNIEVLTMSKESEDKTRPLQDSATPSILAI